MKWGAFMSNTNLEAIKIIDKKIKGDPNKIFWGSYPAILAPSLYYLLIQVIYAGIHSMLIRITRCQVL